MATTTLFTQNIIACIWDFDKTLIPEYMQVPLFRRYDVVDQDFWTETNTLIEVYRRRGYHVSGENGYLNHLLSYVKHGKMAGLNNKILRECGREIRLYPGLPEFFAQSREWVKEKPEFEKHEFKLEHYIVSTGLAEMIRGSAIAPEVDGIWACEFIENPLPPGFIGQKEFDIQAEAEIAQIGALIDNTTKTRALFEINKGTNKNPEIDVNANIALEDRRIPFQNMIYIADGPSDVPCFSVVKKNGGMAYAVYNPESGAEFEQNDRLRQVGRIDHYGPADYTPNSPTTRWLKMHVQAMCSRIAANRESAISAKVSRPPRHLNSKSDKKNPAPKAVQGELLTE